MSERVLSDHLCECGCGQRTLICVSGYNKGKPNRFAHAPRLVIAAGPNQSGLCMCGCGRPTPIASQTRRERGDVAGMPIKYLRGHSRRTRETPTGEGPNPAGLCLCLCGCGEPTAIATKTSTSQGDVEGTPRRYVRGHFKRPRVVPNCGCGCGQPVKRHAHRFIVGHDRTPEVHHLDPASGCWIWDGSAYTTKEGPRLRWGDELAYRKLYKRRIGPIPDGCHLHHRCENPMCVNPAHLEPLTPAEHAKRHHP